MAGAKKVALLGSTGSIGRQSLEVMDVIGCEVVALAAHSNIDLLLEQARCWRPAIVAVTDEAAAEAIAPGLARLPEPPQLFSGKDAARRAAEEADVDTVLNAVVGVAGLSATLAALEKGRDVALANKESLVAGGALALDAARKTGTRLLPVDSEHSAIFQCLQDPHSAKALRRILLTASGGPFYGWDKQHLQNVTSQDALQHPNWSMGRKITIDSATLMNKGLELIEAMWLFGLPADSIEIVVQRESVIHSMVELADHSILAQLGVPDMRIPIQYALTWPERVPGPAPALDFGSLASLTFGKPDEETFRCLAACRKAARLGGLAPCAANGANEEAVALFLREEIGFLDIGRLVEACVDAGGWGSNDYTFAEVVDCDAEARKFVRKHAGLA